MLELVFRDRKTDHVNYAITEVRVVRHITPSEVGFTDKDGRIRSCSFVASEKLEVIRTNP